jgi:hypothetical protein
MTASRSKIFTQGSSLPDAAGRTNEITIAVQNLTSRKPIEKGSYRNFFALCRPTNGKAHRSTVKISGPERATGAEGA